MGVAVNNIAYKLGYGYFADKQNLPLDYGTTPVPNGMYLFKAVSTLADPGAGMKTATRGFSRLPCIGFDQFGPSGLFELAPAMTYMNELNAFTAPGPVPNDI